MNSQSINESLQLYGPADAFSTRSELPFHCSHDTSHRQELAEALANRVQTLFANHTFMDRIRGSIPRGINHAEVELEFSVNTQGLSVSLRHNEGLLSSHTYHIHTGYDILEYAAAASSSSSTPPLITLPAEEDKALAGISQQMINDANAIYGRCVPGHHHTEHAPHPDPWAHPPVAPVYPHTPPAPYAAPLPVNPTFYPRSAPGPVHHMHWTGPFPAQAAGSAQDLAPLRAHVHQLGVKMAELSNIAGTENLARLTPINPATASPQELANYLQRATIYLGDIQDRIHALNTDRHHDKMDLAQNQELKALNRDLWKANERLQNALDKAQAAYEANCQQSIRSIEALQEELEELNNDYSAALKAAEQQHREALANQEQTHAQQLERLIQLNAEDKAQAEAHAAKLKQIYDQSLEQLQAEYDKQMSALHKQYKARLNDAIQEFEKAKQHYETGFAQLKTTYQEALARQNSANQALIDKFDARVQKLQHEHARQVSRLNNAHTAKLAALDDRMNEIESTLSSIEDSLQLESTSASSSNPSLETRLDSAQERLDAIDAALKKRGKQPRVSAIHHISEETQEIIPLRFSTSEELITTPPPSSVTTLDEVHQEIAAPSSIASPIGKNEHQGLAEELGLVQGQIAQAQKDKTLLQRLALSEKEKTDYFLENLYFSQVEDMEMDGETLVVTLSAELASQLGLGNQRQTITVLKNGQISTQSGQANISQHRNFYLKLIKLRKDTILQLQKVQMLEAENQTPWANWKEENFKSLTDLFHDLALLIQPNLLSLSSEGRTEKKTTHSTRALKEIARKKIDKQGAARFTTSPMVNYWHLWLLLHSTITVTTRIENDTALKKSVRNLGNQNQDKQPIIAKKAALFEGLVVSKSSTPALLPEFKKTFQAVFELFSSGVTPRKRSNSETRPKAASSVSGSKKSSRSQE